MALPIVNNSRYETTIPSTGKAITFRPYLVKEEKILMVAMESKDEKQIASALTDVISACVFDDIDVSKLTMFDIESIFLRLRSKSVGETSELRLKCSSCEESTDVSINLDEIEVPVTDSVERTVQLTDEIGVVLRYPSMSDMQKYKQKELETVEGITNLIADCIDSIFDNENVYNVKEEPRKNIMGFLDGLNTKQFTLLAEFFGSAPTLVHEVEFKCRSCGKGNSLEIKGLQSFFS